MTKNILCTDKDLRNEAGVESFFMARMLKDLLGYKDTNIRLKETIETLSVSAGRRRVLYRPDFASQTQRTWPPLVTAKSGDRKSVV